MKLGKLLLKGLSKKSSIQTRIKGTPPRSFTPRKTSEPKRPENRRKIAEKRPSSSQVITSQNHCTESESNHSPVLSIRDLVRPSQALREQIEAFLLDQRSEHTRRAYSRDLKRFVQYLLMRRFQAEETGNDLPQSIDRSLVIAYKEFLLSEKLEHTTIDRHLATLRSFFSWLELEGVITKNPADAVRFLNPRRLSKTNGLSDEEVERMLSQPDLHTRVGALHYAVLMVLFHCGLRRSELCALTYASMSSERGHFVLKLRGKGNSERILPLLPSVMNAIRWYRKITQREDCAPETPLFTPVKNNRTGELEKHLDPSSVFYMVVKTAKAAGITQKISPHSCRATAISHARDRQVPDRAIQEFAGWSTPDMITRYDKRKTLVEKSAALVIHYGDAEKRAPVLSSEPSQSDPVQDSDEARLPRDWNPPPESLAPEL